LSDDTEAVVFEVSKAVSAALDELHLSMEALGNAIVLGEAPHASDGLGPGAQRGSQSDERLEATGGEPVDEAQQLTGEGSAGAPGLVLEVEQGAQTLHFIIEGLQGWMCSKEASQEVFTAFGEVGRVHAQGSEGAGVVFDLRGDLTSEVHEMLDDNANDMEAIGNDAGIGEPAADQGAVRTGEVDADHLDAFAALEVLKEGDDVGAGSTLDDIEDLVIFKIAKGGGESLALVEGVLVDTEHNGALET